jgi:hypothetical protein
MSTPRKKSRRNPKLSVEQEYDIAISAAEIFLKDEKDRTPEEQAYVIAMQEYLQKLEEHMKKTKSKPQYGLASGTALFCMSPQKRTLNEQQYVKSIAEDYVSELQQRKNVHLISVDVQTDIAKKGLKIVNKKERKSDEEAYVRLLSKCSREIEAIERVHGLSAHHSLLSETVTLTKYPEKRSIEEQEFICDILRE